MKTFKIALSAILFTCLSLSVAAQEKTEKFKVSGNCGMCKNKIEKAAKSAGATYAFWDEDTKQLEVKYSSNSTNAARIQEKIAETGYDNAGAKATDEAYSKLHGCCKYDREAASHSCCKDGVCSEAEAKGCCVDGKCTNTSDDCCEGGKCTKKDHKKKSKSKSTAKKA